MDFPYTLDNKRYHTLHYDNRMRFGGRVCKAALDVGMTCPNRDGTLGTGGCIYCDSGSRYFAGEGSLLWQLREERQRIQEKNPDAKLIAYFQAGSNTYCAPERLEELLQTAVTFPDVVGISVATRGDCLGEDHLALLREFAEKTALTVELGLQTVHDRTAEAIRRGHDFDTFLRGYEALRERGIRTCVHLINGLPGESPADMLESARVVGRLRPGGVKLHLMHVIRGTALAELWETGAYTPMEKEDYVEIITEQLRLLPPETVIERLTGDGDRRTLLSPLWSRDKRSVLGAIDKRMAEKDIWQGDRFEE